MHAPHTFLYFRNKGTRDWTGLCQVLLTHLQIRNHEECYWWAQCSQSLSLSLSVHAHTHMCVCVINWEAARPINSDFPLCSYIFGDKDFPSG